MNAVMRTVPTVQKLALRLLLGGYVGLAGLNAQAAEEPSAVDPAFGNTVVSTYPDGRSQRVWLHRDGTWSGLSRRGNDLAGVWTVKDQKICFKQTRPPTLPVKYCSPFPEHAAVGIQWTSKDLTGTPIRLSLQKGIVTQSKPTR